MWRVRARVSPTLSLPIEMEKCVGRSYVGAEVEDGGSFRDDKMICWGRPACLCWSREVGRDDGGYEEAVLDVVPMISVLFREEFLPSMVEDEMDIRLRTIFLRV